MDALSIFSLIVLIVLGLAFVAAWIALAILPGRIAARRNHQQAEAVKICGYWGALTLGLLMPVAFVWAYWRFDNNSDRAAGRKDQ